MLAALGYRSDLDRDRRPLLFGLVAAVALVAVLSWQYWPASTPPPATRVAHNIPPSPPPIVPVPAPVTMPAGNVTVLPQGGNHKDESHAATVANPVATAPPVHVAPKTASNDVAVDRHAALPAPAEPPASSDFQLALYYQRTGDFEQALVAYKKLLQHDELNVEAHNNLGMLYQGKGLYEDAAREFQRVLAIDQAYPTAHLNLSAAYLKLGKPDAAAAEARAVLALEPRQSDALVNLALAQDASGQPGDARLTLRRALEIAPHHAAAHYNLAQQYERAGEPALAVDHYRQFLQYAGPEQSAYVADARVRLQALGSRQ